MLRPTNKKWKKNRTNKIQRMTVLRSLGWFKMKLISQVQVSMKLIVNMRVEKTKCQRKNLRLILRRPYVIPMDTVENMKCQRKNIKHKKILRPNVMPQDNQNHNDLEALMKKRPHRMKSTIKRKEDWDVYNQLRVKSSTLSRKEWRT